MVTALASAGSLRAEVINYSARSAEFIIDLFAVAPDSQLYGLGEDAFTIAGFEWPRSSGIMHEFTHTETALDVESFSGAYSVALLVDQSSSVAELDPNDARLVAAEAFMGNLSSGAEAGLVAYAAGGRLPFSPTTSYGDPQDNRFTMDADGFDLALGALADLEGGTRPLYDALRIAIDYTTQHAATTNRSVLVLAGGDDEGSVHSLDEAIELAIQRGVAIHAVGLSPAANPNALTQLAARTGGSISGTTAAPRLVSYYGALGSLLSGSAPFYRTTWELNIFGGNFSLYSGYWIRASVAISTPEGTLYVPFRLDFE